jgi:hypothetical protein
VTARPVARIDDLIEYDATTGATVWPHFPSDGKLPRSSGRSLCAWSAQWVGGACRARGKETAWLICVDLTSRSAIELQQTPSSPLGFASGERNMYSTWQADHNSSRHRDLTSSTAARCCQKL